MSLLIGFLTFVLVMNCLLLMLLVLIQLPKKEAGAGVAFGGAATDALFGAGSGTALTKITKYAATFFVILSVTLSVLHMRAAREGSRLLERELSRQAATGVVPAPAPVVQTNVLTFSSTPEAPVTVTPVPPQPAGTTTTEASAATATPAPQPSDTGAEAQSPATTTPEQVTAQPAEPAPQQ